jgi:hypothetical protein
VVFEHICPAEGYRILVANAGGRCEPRLYPQTRTHTPALTRTRTHTHALTRAQARTHARARTHKSARRSTARALCAAAPTSGRKPGLYRRGRRTCVWEHVLRKPRQDVEGGAHAHAHAPSALMPRLMRHLSNFYAAVDLGVDGPHARARAQEHTQTRARANARTCARAHTHAQFCSESTFTDHSTGPLARARTHSRAAAHSGGAWARTTATRKTRGPAASAAHPNEWSRRGAARHSAAHTAQRSRAALRRTHAAAHLRRAGATGGRAGSITTRGTGAVRSTQCAISEGVGCARQGWRRSSARRCTSTRTHPARASPRSSRYAASRSRGVDARAGLWRARGLARWQARHCGPVVGAALRPCGRRGIVARW